MTIMEFIPVGATVFSVTAMIVYVLVSLLHSPSWTSENYALYISINMIVCGMTIMLSLFLTATLVMCVSECMWPHRCPVHKTFTTDWCDACKLDRQNNNNAVATTTSNG